jgi:hypothetical protein
MLGNLLQLYTTKLHFFAVLKDGRISSWHKERQRGAPKRRTLQKQFGETPWDVKNHNFTVHNCNRILLGSEVYWLHERPADLLSSTALGLS